MLVPGNGDADLNEIWYPYVKRELEKLGLMVIAKKMPDSNLARKEYWLPFIAQQIGEDNAILIGHSSGALAIMRYAETHKVLGLILISACHTDLGDEKERASHYFDEPWQWDKIKQNTQWIIQFGSTDDPYISIKEMHYVRDKLKTEYYEFADRGHFNIEEFPEIIKTIKKKLE